MEFLLYGADTGTATLYAIEPRGDKDSPPSVVRDHLDLGRRWTHIVSGWFTDDRMSSLLCYNANNGSAAFVQAGTGGSVTTVRETDTWRRGWTHILPVYLGKRTLDGIIFYNASSGTAQIYSTDGQGYISRLYDYTWRKGWSHILAGEFDYGVAGSVSDLFFYGSASGAGQAYSIDGEGAIRKVRDHSLEPGWTHLVRGQLGAAAGHRMLFYDSRAGRGRSCGITSGSGTLDTIATHGDMRHGWTHVLPVPSAWAENLLFYDAADGGGSLFRATSRGELTRSSEDFRLPRNGTILAAGHFQGPGAAEVRRGGAG